MPRTRKFTVREISITAAVVAVVALVSVLAIRSYYQYFLRARIIGAVSGLADLRAGVATLVVDKDYRALSALADRVLLMTKGELVFSGTPAELKAQPELLERHLGV